MPNKTGFFCDLDGVAFNSCEFGERCILASIALGISRNDHVRTYKEIKSRVGYHDVSKHIELLTKGDRGLADSLGQAWVRVLKNSKDLVYSDTKDFLSTLKASHASLDMTLVTRGDRTLQNNKLFFTGLDTFFSIHKFVSTGSKGETIAKQIAEFGYKVAIFIDDRLEELLDVQKTLLKMDGLKCKTHLIWLTRKAKEQSYQPLIEFGREDPLSMFVGEIIPVPDLYTLQKMYQQMMKGENS